MIVGYKLQSYLKHKRLVVGCWIKKAAVRHMVYLKYMTIVP